VTAHRPSLVMPRLVRWKAVPPLIDDVAGPDEIIVGDGHVDDHARSSISADQVFRSGRLGRGSVGRVLEFLMDLR